MIYFKSTNINIKINKHMSCYLTDNSYRNVYIDIVIFIFVLNTILWNQLKLELCQLKLVNYKYINILLIYTCKTFIYTLFYFS